MADQDGQRAGLGSFVCIMISSFFVFAFINGVIHSLYTSPGIGAEAVLRFTNTVMPMILMVMLFSLLWMAITLFRNVNWTTGPPDRTGPGYATLSAMEAPEPYFRMLQERQELLKSPRLRAKSNTGSGYLPFSNHFHFFLSNFNLLLSPSVLRTHTHSHTHSHMHTQTHSHTHTRTHTHTCTHTHS